MCLLRTAAAILFIAPLIISSVGAPVETTGTTIPVKIAIPDTNEVVTSDIPSHSAIPQCLRESSNVTEDDEGLHVPAQIFTECAKKELRRLQNDIKYETGRPTGGAASDSATVPGEVKLDSPQVQDVLPYDENEEEESPEDYDEKPSKGALEEEPKVEKPKVEEPKVEEPKAEEPKVEERKVEEPKAEEPTPITPKKAVEEPAKIPHEAPKIPDLTTITNAFDSVKPISEHPGVLGEVVRVLQVIFDYKRVQSDLQRILNGDIHKVLQEYPDRAKGFFQLIVSLPERFKGAANDVQEVKKESPADGPYSDVFGNLQAYMNSAAQTSQQLPNMLSLVSTVDALRNIATQLSGLVAPRGFGGFGAGLLPTPPPSPQAALLNEITSVFQHIPATFGSFLNGGRSFGLGRGHRPVRRPVRPPVEPSEVPSEDKPVSPHDEVAAHHTEQVEAKSANDPPAFYKDVATASLAAFDTVSKTLYDILTRDAKAALKEQERQKHE
ncbi:uncharacterized protein LOC135401375 isoform X2 [Ornithodoros turicata]|uniref:uncharacterized protein LOC135401375 isoform X2 n=1 Tax=Ornithodoros turicata TaxID=34597 RepID=UPI0031386AB3